MKLGNLVLDKDEYSVDELISIAKKYADSRVGSAVADKDVALKTLQDEVVSLKSGFDAEKATFDAEKAALLADKVELEGKLSSSVDEVRHSFVSKFDEHLNLLRGRAGDKLADLVDDLPGDSADKVAYLLKHSDTLFSRGSVGFGSETGVVNTGQGSGIVASVKAMPGKERMTYLANPDNMAALKDELGGNDAAFAEIVFGE